MSGLIKRVTKLETRTSAEPRQYTVYRTIVSRCADGSLKERLSTIRGFGKLLRRSSAETKDEFLARAEQELKEQDK
ncbi:hypothetical protein [Ruegeria atlantica]|uniref:hypothetical protein n=1 Tax=Ruegeria atlantica TaxID=81569 RepID=UPI00147A84F4|nr:hypothetical protein [Ruegeria atlantica]